MESKIKTISIYRRNIPADTPSGGGPDAEKLLVSTAEYDAVLAKPVLETQYDAEGMAEQQTRYSYDESGFLIREVLTDASGEVLEEKSFEPDEQRRVRREFRHYADGSFDTLAYWYDDAGLVVKKVLSDDEGTIETTETFEYTDGLLVREAVYDGEEDLVSESTYVYDEDGLLDGKETRHLYDGISLRQEYIYNDAGHREAILSYDSDGALVGRVLLTLDEKGRPTGVEEEDKQRKNQTSLQYDDRGHIVFQEEVDMRGELVSRVERTYDDQGLLLRSEVTARNPLRGINQHYEVIHEYSFFG